MKLKSRKVFSVLVLTLFSSIAIANENVRFTGAFESGRIQSAGSKRDGFFIQTLPHPQGNTDYVDVGSGGAGPGSGLDTRVVPSERVGSETIRPRKGDYFLRSALYYNKDYSRMSFNKGCKCNLPRSTMMLGNDSLRFDWDQEMYVGFSIYTPKNQEDELGVKDHRGGSQLLSTKPSSSTRTQFSLSQYAKGSQNQMHWWLNYHVGDKSTQESDGKEIWVDLGPVGPDRGRWTDFVIRFRLNPFKVDTNPAARGIPNSVNKMYRGNRGIFQVWKSEGGVDSNGDRPMRLKINKVNEPMGLVPHATDKPHFSFRIYKYGWHNNPTTVKGPVWYGFDEIRFGTVQGDGTTYEDVYPGNGGGGTTGGLKRPKPPVLSAQ